MRRRRLRRVACLVVAAFMASAPGSAAAFGTIDSGGQNREHERITRAALACAGDAGSDPYCFEPRSIDSLAGHDRAFGAVGAPDNDELSDPAAHCDNADFLEGGYPRTRDQATASLVACVNHLRSRFGEGVEAAQGLLDDQGQVNPGAVNLAAPRSHRDSEDRAKCLAMEGLGRALHGAQDFYAHSNWADEADPTRPIGDDQPAGSEPARAQCGARPPQREPPSVPAELTTGCFVVRGRGSRCRRMRAACHPCGAQQGPGVDRPRDREDHRADDAAWHGRGQLREGGVGGGRRDPPTVEGFSVGADGALWAGERRAHDLCTDARRSCQ